MKRLLGAPATALNSSAAALVHRAVLLCRRQPGRPYRLCGRLEPVALAIPVEGGDGVRDGESDVAYDVDVADDVRDDAEEDAGDGDGDDATGRWLRFRNAEARAYGDAVRPLRRWRTRPRADGALTAAHIVWRLVDAEPLLSAPGAATALDSTESVTASVVDELFGAAGIAPSRPEIYPETEARRPESGSFH